MLNINFSELHKNYEKDLLSKLRGFGDEKEFLKYWVPDSDLYKSALNLIDTLAETKNYTFNIIFQDGSDKLIEKLINLNKKIGEVKSIKKNVILFNIAPDLYNNFSKSEIEVKSKKKVKLSYEEVKFLKEREVNERIEESYRNVLKNYKIVNFFHNANEIFNKFDKKNYDSFIKYFNDEKFLSSIVEKESGIVIKSFHNIPENMEKSKIIDLACSLAKNKPLYELADHLTIYLEYKIRSEENFKNKNLPKGVILPHHAGGLFDLISNLFRDFYKQYKKINNKTDVINKSYIEPSKEWLNLNNEEREKKIRELLNLKIFNKFNINEKDLILERIIGTNRLIFKINENLNKLAYTNILFKIENIIKKEIDPSLELLFTEKKDMNVLRLSNEPKSL